MKQLLALIVCGVLMLSVSVAFASDLSSMSDTQLKEQLDAIRNELTVRGLVTENKTVLFDQNGVQIYINGDVKVAKPYDWADEVYLYIPVIVVNSSGDNYGITLENASVNGWSVYGDDENGATPAGKKSKATLYFELEDTDVETLEDFTDVEFLIRIYNTDTFMTVFSSDPITVYKK